jgi:sulfofructose kinase
MFHVERRPLQSRMPNRIIVVGHAAHDLVYRVAAIPTRPIKVVATDLYECGGGMAGNAAVAAARLGGRVEYWGRVAADALGDRIVGDLQAERVDVSNVKRIDGARSPATSILIAPNGERLICSFPAALDPDPSWLPLERIETAGAVLVDVRWPAGASAVLAAARAAGRPALLDADVGSVDALEHLAGIASHLLFSAAGLELISDALSPSRALGMVRRPHHAAVGVTLGEEGFLWIDDAGEHRVPSPKVHVVDTLAAGDVWHGAFAVAIAEGQRVAESAAFANAAAALKCQRPGGRLGAPSRPEVEALLR